MQIEWPLAFKVARKPQRPKYQPSQPSQAGHTPSPRSYRGLIAAGLALNAGLLLSACAVQPALLPAASDPATELLARYQHGQHLDGAMRAQNIAQLRVRIAAEPSLVNRTELALLFTHPDADADDRRAASELLASCAGEPATTALAGLCLLTGRMLANDVELNRRLAIEQTKIQEAEARAFMQREQLDALTSQSAAKEDAETRRIASLERQLGDQHKQIDSLRRQMRELQAIERSIEDRHGTGNSP